MTITTDTMPARAGPGWRYHAVVRINNREVWRSIGLYAEVVALMHAGHVANAIAQRKGMHGS